jgi:hypothetical protein
MNEITSETSLFLAEFRTASELLYISMVYDNQQGGKI